jgi:hypothetical protein
MLYRTFKNFGPNWIELRRQRNRHFAQLNLAVRNRTVQPGTSGPLETAQNLSSGADFRDLRRFSAPHKPLRARLFPPPLGAVFAFLAIVEA